MALTTAQTRILDQMKARENSERVGKAGDGLPYSTAYDVGAQMRTMQALVNAGSIYLVESALLGSVFTPRTTFRYRVARATA